jgi:choline dehydrogenase
VSYPRFLAPSGGYIGAGLTELGLAELPGMVNGDLLGWMSCGCTIDPNTQTRSSSETSMLRQSINESFNLQVYTHALAKNILFNNHKRAVGVRVQVSGIGSGDVTFNIRAKKEVIVSAGAFRSPQLLMVSGIGPRETLEANGIEVISERKGVGRNLWDHIW